MNFQTKTTWQHIRRSPYQAMSAIMIMTLTFIVGLIFVYLSFGADKLLSEIEKRPQVILFFNDNVTQESQVADLKTKILNSGKSSKVKFVSKEDALKIYQEKNKSDQLLLELVTAKTLPASLEIGADKASDLNGLYNLVKEEPNVEEISYQKDIVDNLAKLVEKVRKVGAISFGFLVATSILIILTIIGMKISIHKDEIEVQRLIGASKWYIRWPFVFEGILYGILGSFFAWVVVVAMVVVLPHFLSDISGLPVSLPTTSLNFSTLTKVVVMVAPFHLTKLLIALVCGIVVGTLGSFLAVWRYLKD